MCGHTYTYTHTSTHGHMPKLKQCVSYSKVLFYHVFFDREFILLKLWEDSFFHLFLLLLWQ